MSHRTESITAAAMSDMALDADCRLSMKAALREFRTDLRKSAKAHPLRDEMLVVLADARKSIDRINAKAA